MKRPRELSPDRCIFPPPTYLWGRILITRENMTSFDINNV
jgi:hypothetical protein